MPARDASCGRRGLHLAAALVLDRPVIVTCPNCSARYRLSEDVVARRARLKCAACDHRWVPEAPAAAEPQPADAEAPPPEPVAVAAAPEPPAPPPEPRASVATASDYEEEEEEPRSHLVRNLVAAFLGIALAIAAAGLWLGRIDPAQIPYVGDTLATLVPSGQPLQITVTGTVTPLPSGGRVLDVSGTITNPGHSLARVPLLKASLVGPTGPARRWTISPPVAELAPGASAHFSSTVMGFPAEARTLAVTPGY